MSPKSPGVTKEKESDNVMFYLQDLYESSIGQRKPAKAPGLGKPSHNGPESMTTNPRSRNQRGCTLIQASDSHLVACELHDMPIGIIPITTTRYTYRHNMARLYFVLLSCGVWLEEPCIFDPA